MATKNVITLLNGADKVIRSVSGSGDTPATGELPMLSEVTTGVIKIANTLIDGTAVLAGARQGQPVQIGADLKIAAELLPDSVGDVTFTAVVDTGVTLVNGDLVHIASSGKCKKALSDASLLSAIGFVKAGYTATDTAVIYREGTVTVDMADTTGYVPGKVLFLSSATGGKTMITYPEVTAGCLLQQCVGKVISVITNTSVKFMFSLKDDEIYL